MERRQSKEAFLGALRPTALKAITALACCLVLLTTWAALRKSGPLLRQTRLLRQSDRALRGLDDVVSDLHTALAVRDASRNLPQQEQADQLRALQRRDIRQLNSLRSLPAGSADPASIDDAVDTANHFYQRLLSCVWVPRNAQGGVSPDCNTWGGALGWRVDQLRNTITMPLGKVSPLLTKATRQSLPLLVGSLAVMSLMLLLSLAVMTNSRRRRQKVLAQLQSAEALYQAILDSAAEGIAGIDHNGRTHFINDSALRLLGYSRAGVLRREQHLLWHQHSGGLQSSCAMHGLEQPASEGVDELLRADQTLVPVHYSASPLRDDAGRLLGRVCTLRDARRELELERGREEFIAHVAHRLRAPFKAVSNSLELLRAGELGELPAAIEPLLDVASRNSARTMRLVSTLLEMERIRAGKEAFHFEFVAAVEVLQGLRAALTAELAERGITLQLSNAPQECRIWADAARLHEALTAVVRYSASRSVLGSSISVRIMVSPAGMRSAGQGEEVTFSIEDQTSAIPMLVKRLLGDDYPLVQSDPELTGEALGLSLAAAVARHHGSGLQVLVLNLGNRFSLSCVTREADLGAALSGVERSKRLGTSLASYSRLEAHGSSGSAADGTQQPEQETGDGARSGEEGASPAVAMTRKRWLQFPPLRRLARALQSLHAVLHIVFLVAWSGLAIFAVVGALDLHFIAARAGQAAHASLVLSEIQFTTDAYGTLREASTQYVAQPADFRPWAAAYSAMGEIAFYRFGRLERFLARDKGDTSELHRLESVMNPEAQGAIHCMITARDEGSAAGKSCLARLGPLADAYPILDLLRGNAFAVLSPLSGELDRASRLVVALIWASAILSLCVLLLAVVLHRVNVLSLRHRMRAIRLLSARSRAILDSLATGFCGTDEKGSIRFVNRAGAALLGSRPEDLLGRSATQELFGQVGGAQWLASVSTPPALCLESRHRGQLAVRGGDAIAADYTVAALSGKGRGYVISFQDVRPRLKLEERQRQFTESFVFLLRNALTPVRATIGLLAGETVARLTPAMASIVSIAARSAERMQHLLEMLAPEEVPAGEVALQIGPWDAAALAYAARQQVESGAERRSVRVEVSAPLQALPCNADGERLVQVLASLLTNAVEASEQRSVVELRLEASAPLRRRGVEALMLAREGVIFQVVDHGRGIARERLALLFTPFAAARQTSTEEPSETGWALTLPVCREIVERHGGSLWVESELGAGTTFTLWIPRNPPQPATSALSSWPAASLATS